MTRSRILAGAFLVSGWWAGSVVAQTPAPATGTTASAEAAKPGICERIEKGIDRKRRKLCQTPLGNMLNSITRPFNTFTGGIIPNFCPGKPSEEDLKKPGAEGAAAQAAKDAAEAQARRKAVRLMGTFDCHWYPEAEAGLVAALRTDRAECVRLEAAIALNRGCCCTRAIVEALEETVAGTDKLGPSENSPRVRAVALMALERCLTCPEAHEILESPPSEDKDKEKPGEETPSPKPNAPADQPPSGGSAPNSAAPAQPPQYGPSSQRGSGKPSRALLIKAHHTLQLAKARESRPAGNSDVILPAGERSLAGVARYAIHGRSTPEPIVNAAASAPISPALNAVASTAGPLPKVNVKTPPTKAASSGAPVTSHNDSRETPDPQSKRPNSPYRAVAVEEAKHEESVIDQQVQYYLDVLRNAADPEIRHGAALKLAELDGNEHPVAIFGLLTAARHDPHAGMRVACIRALARMKAATPEVLTSLRPMTRDPDDWIRLETTKALAVLEAAANQR